MPPLYDLGLYCRPPGAKPKAARYVLGVGRWLGSPGTKPEASPRVPKSRGCARILGPIARHTIARVWASLVPNGGERSDRRIKDHAHELICTDFCAM